MNDYETQRAAKIAKNQALLATLDIKTLTGRKPVKSDRNGEPQAKRRKIESAPSRTSARIASAPIKPDYNDDVPIKTITLPRSATKKSKRGALGSVIVEELEVEALVPAKDIDEIRAGWTSWTPTAQPPTRGEDAVFHFEDDFETFTPNKSPEEMLRLGVFGGSYFRALKSRKLGVVVQDDWKELPPSWTVGLNVSKSLTSPVYNPEINKNGVQCGQSIEEWEAAGWISHEHDVRGWFQWYCRFFQGRRCDDDERQISRWRKCVGVTGRFRSALLKQYGRAGVRTAEDYGDEDGDEDDGVVARGISPVVSQTCLHWGWEVRQGDLDGFWATT
nr:hypothetical protein B0A51_16023 [Rachicladosporium sp. CCFEE 5018]